MLPFSLLDSDWVRKVWRLAYLVEDSSLPPAHTLGNPIALDYCEFSDCRFGVTAAVQRFTGRRTRHRRLPMRTNQRLTYLAPQKEALHLTVARE